MVGTDPCSDALGHPTGNVLPIKLQCPISAFRGPFVDHLHDFGGEFCSLHRGGAVFVPPDVERLDELLANRVTGLEFCNAAHGIGAAERKQWIATPRSPQLETAKRDAGIERVLPPPSPNGEAGRE